MRNYLKALGLGMTIGEVPKPSEFQHIADATKDRPDAQQIHMMLLRSMSQAIYSPHNSGHFGLAYEAYTHFTSPIRRYPDLLVHRVIKSILNKRRYQLPELPTPGEAHEKLSRRLQKTNASRPQTEQTPARRTAETLAWEAAGLHCSANERRADEASRDVEAWLKCKYMREHLGEEFSGAVSAVTSFGLFVTLDELYVEGLVHITELGGEYFRFDEVRQELRGERTGIRYALGTRVRVQVSRVDLDGRRIDFRLVQEGEDLASRAMRDKGVAPAGERGMPSKVSAKRAARKTREQEKAENSGDSYSSGRFRPSPVQVLKASVKKAASKARAAKAKKTKR